MDCYMKQRCPGNNARCDMASGSGNFVGADIPIAPVLPIPPASGEMIDSYPIAMAYVPWQTWQQVYPLDQALNRGTIFPELDKPFMMGRCR